MFSQDRPRGSRYREKSRGPKIEPCGTPYDNGAEQDSEPPRYTPIDLPSRYDLNQFRALPLMPTRCCKRDTKILWSTVSKAAVGSKQDKDHVVSRVSRMEDVVEDS